MRLFLLLCSCTLLFFACKTSSTSTTSEEEGPSIFEEAYYRKLPNNIERLSALRSGFFVLKGLHRETGEVISNTTDLGDSVLVYARQVGIPNRDGYWFFQVQFTGSLPNDPLVFLVERIEQISRDTFEGSMHIVTKNYTLEELSAPDLDVSDMDFKEIKDTSQVLASYTYVRRGLSEYDCYTSRFPPVNQQVREIYALRQDHFHYSPKGITLERFYYTKEGKRDPRQELETIISFFQRLSPETFEAYKAEAFGVEEE